MAKKTVQHKSKQYTPIKSKKNILLIRYGGRGDALFLTPTIARLRKLGYKVDVAVNDKGEEILRNNPNINTLYLLERQAPYVASEMGIPVNLVEIDGVKLPIEALFRNYPSDSVNRSHNVVDYYRSIEQNTIHPHLYHSQNSDQINAYDTHSSWAGLNPNEVPKRPEYYPTKEEIAEGEKILGSFTRPIVMWQPLASSPARSIASNNILNWVKTKEVSVLEYIQRVDQQDGFWALDGIKIDSPIKGFRLTGALLSAMSKNEKNFVISADTCISHMAEALNVKHLTFYTTVPAWTRSSGYEYEVTVDSNYQYNHHDCKCCAISRDCPLVVANAFKKLPERKQQLIGCIDVGHPVRKQFGIPTDFVFRHPDPVAYFGLASQYAFEQAIGGALKDLEINLQALAPCVSNIEPKLKKVIQQELGD